MKNIEVAFELSHSDIKGCDFQPGVELTIRAMIDGWDTSGDDEFKVFDDLGQGGTYYFKSASRVPDLTAFFKPLTDDFLDILSPADDKAIDAPVPDRGGWNVRFYRKWKCDTNAELVELQALLKEAGTRYAEQLLATGKAMMAAGAARHSQSDPAA